MVRQAAVLRVAALQVVVLRAAAPRAAARQVAVLRAVVLQVAVPRAVAARQVVCRTPGAVPLAGVRAVTRLPAVPVAAPQAQDLPVVAAVAG